MLLPLHQNNKHFYLCYCLFVLPSWDKNNDHIWEISHCTWIRSLLVSAPQFTNFCIVSEGCHIRKAPWKKPQWMPLQVKLFKLTEKQNKTNNSTCTFETISKYNVISNFFKLIGWENKLKSNCKLLKFTSQDLRFISSKQKRKTCSQSLNACFWVHYDGLHMHMVFISNHPFTAYMYMHNVNYLCTLMGKPLYQEVQNKKFMYFMFVF